MKQKLKSLALISVFSLVPTLFVWLPFFLRIGEFWNIPLPKNGMATIVANYDGPLYIVVAKTFYNTLAIKNNFQFALPVEYYAAHFPLYPALIKAFSFVLGFPYAMLAVTVLSSIVATYFFYKLALSYLKETDALWLAFIFSILPARWLIVRSVGSPEPLFVASFIASVYFFKHKKYLWAGIWGAIAQLTKSPAILLFGAYFLYLAIPKIRELVTTKYKNVFKIINFKPWFVFLIPAALLVVFGIYGLTYKDFFAYFHSGDNIHLFFPPFQIFNYSAPWVGTFWLEEVIYIYLFGALGLIELIRQKDELLAWVVGVFFATTIFVSHRDLMRYTLPIVPFLLISFRNVLTKKRFRFVVIFLIIPIYLFTLAYISQNTMPIADWRPLL